MALRAVPNFHPLAWDGSESRPYRIKNMWEVMFWPIAACVLLPWLLVYLGLHVVQRGIIFIDIAMAQMASLGICVAVLLHFEPESLMAYLIGLAVTLVGAAIFSTTGKRESQVP